MRLAPVSPQFGQVAFIPAGHVPPALKPVLAGFVQNQRYTFSTLNLREEEIRALETLVPLGKPQPTAKQDERMVLNCLYITSEGDLFAITNHQTADVSALTVRLETRPGTEQADLTVLHFIEEKVQAGQVNRVA